MNFSEMAGLNKLDERQKKLLLKVQFKLTCFLSNFPFLLLSAAPAVGLQARCNFLQSFLNLYSPGYVYSYRH